MKRSREGAAGKRGGRPRTREPLEVGQSIRDVRERRTGIVLERACQYAHPKADPVYNYLIRWQDGQVQAINESALAREYGLEPVD